MLSANGRFVMSMDRDKKVRMFDAETKLRVYDVETGRNIFESSYFSAYKRPYVDANRVLFPSKRILESMAIDGAGATRQKHSQLGYCDEFAVATDVPLVAIRDENSVAVWNLETEKLVFKLPDGINFPTRSVDGMATLALSPSGRVLATVDADSIIQTWNIGRIRQLLAEVDLDWASPLPADKDSPSSSDRTLDTPIHSARMAAAQQNWRSAIDQYESLISQMDDESDLKPTLLRERGLCRNKVGEFERFFTDFQAAQRLSGETDEYEDEYESAKRSAPQEMRQEMRRAVHQEMQQDVHQDVQREEREMALQLAENIWLRLVRDPTADPPPVSKAELERLRSLSEELDDGGGDKILATLAVLSYRLIEGTPNRMSFFDFDQPNDATPHTTSRNAVYVINMLRTAGGDWAEEYRQKLHSQMQADGVREHPLCLALADEVETWAAYARHRDHASTLEHVRGLIRGDTDASAERRAKALKLAESLAPATAAAGACTVQAEFSDLQALSDWELVYVRSNRTIGAVRFDGRSPTEFVGTWLGNPKLVPKHEASSPYIISRRRLFQVVPDPEQSPKELHKFSRLPYDAAIHPSQNRIALCRWKREGRPDLVLINLDSSEESNLGDGYGPMWTADGNSLIYTSVNKELGWHIAVYDGQQTRRIKVPNHRKVRFYPSPSPDNQQIAFSMKGEDGTKQIGLASWDGVNIQQLTSRGDMNTRSAFSPDGKYIAFLRAKPTEDAEENTGACLVLVNVATGEETVLGNDAGRESRPTWRCIKTE